MFLERTHLLALALGAACFAALLALPAFCATASAHTPVTTGDEHPCSEHDDASSDEESDCCHRCATSCEHDRHSASPTSPGAVVSTYDDEASDDGSTSWWTPDLVATLWLIDRLAASTADPPPAELPALVHLWDRSDIYLTHSVMLR